MIRKNHFRVGSSSTNWTTLSLIFSPVAFSSAIVSPFTFGLGGTAFFSSILVTSPSASKEVSTRVVGLRWPEIYQWRRILTLSISLVNLLTVYHTILTMLVPRICIISTNNPNVDTLVITCLLEKNSVLAIHESFIFKYTVG